MFLLRLVSGQRCTGPLERRREALFLGSHDGQLPPTVLETASRTGGRRCGRVGRGKIICEEDGSLKRKA